DRDVPFLGFFVAEIDRAHAADAEPAEDAKVPDRAQIVGGFVHAAGRTLVNAGALGSAFGVAVAALPVGIDQSQFQRADLGGLRVGEKFLVAKGIEQVQTLAASAGLKYGLDCSLDLITVRAVPRHGQSSGPFLGLGKHNPSPRTGLPPNQPMLS